MRELYYYHELENMYEEWLSECFGYVNICGSNYEAGHALRLIDEISFRCGFSEWEGENFSEINKSDMTEGEIEHHRPSNNTVMYCRKLEQNDN